MKAASFDYIKPKAISQVIDLLQAHGDDARLLAGGIPVDELPVRG